MNFRDIADNGKPQSAPALFLPRRTEKTFADPGQILRLYTFSIIFNNQSTPIKRYMYVSVIHTILYRIIKNIS